MGSITTLSSSCSDEMATITNSGTPPLLRFVPLKGSADTYRIILKDRKGGCYRFLSGQADCATTSVGFAKADLVDGLQRWVISKVADPISPTPTPTTTPKPTVAPSPPPTQPPAQAPTITAASGTSFAGASVTVASSDASVIDCTVTLTPGDISETVLMPPFPGMATVSFTGLAAATSYTATASCRLTGGGSTPSSEPVVFKTLGGSYNRPPPGTATECDGRGETVNELGQCVCDPYNVIDGPFKANGMGGCACFDVAIDLGYGACICPNATVNCLEGCCANEQNGTLPPGPGPCTVQGIVLSPSNGVDYGDSFGFALDLNRDGDKLVVGDYGASSPGSSGLAYVFGYSESGWVEEQILAADHDPDASSSFGFDVAISGDGVSLIAVGDYEASFMFEGEPVSKGKVYLFGNNGSHWVPSDILSPTARSIYRAGFFGRGVAANANGTVMVATDTGAYRASFDGYGVAHIFELRENQWTPVQIIDANAEGGTSAYVPAVAINDAADVIAIGVPTYQSYGIVFIYRLINGEWNMTTTVVGSDSDTLGDYFGGAVDLNAAGDVLAVGDMRACKTTSGCGYSDQFGKVYIFNYNSGTQSWDEEEILTPSDAAWLWEFGFSLDLNPAGDTIVIGATNADFTGSDDLDGSAYVFTKSGGTWSEIAIFNSSISSRARCEYGYSVAINGDGTVVAVSDACAWSPENGPGNAGIVYVYRDNSGTWSEEDILEADDAAFGNYFGTSVAINDAGNLIAVGAPDADDDGKVYIFAESGGSWTQVESFDASDTGSGSDKGKFGEAIAFDATGNRLFVGDFQATVIETNDPDGQVYVFDRSGESFVESEIIPPIGDWYNAGSFGCSVDVNDNGTVVVVGDYEAEYLGISSSGLAYVFMLEEGTWIDHILSAEEYATTYGYFGTSVATNAAGDVVAISAPGPALVFIFEFVSSSWSLTHTFNASEFGDGDGDFGNALALNDVGDVLVVGDYEADLGNGYGEAYVFRYTDGTGWTKETTLTAGSANSSYFGSDVAINAAGDVILVADYAVETGESGEYGLVHLFRYTGSEWDQEVLESTNTSISAYFGTAVAVNGDKDTVVVGDYDGDYSETGNIQILDVC